ncbi:MAG: diguanylate cyclase, partial [Firmicutes bacterium]|nr:diguanylate cyclase [Bacillota bacterium]
MDLDLILSFTSNIILLMGLAVIYSIFPSDTKLTELSKKFIMGLVVSFIGVSIMASHYNLQPGVVFDARAVAISISGMFLGVVPTLIGAFIMVLYRMLEGGVGTFVGVLWIIIAAILGLLWRHLRLKNSRFSAYKVTWIELYMFSLFVQIIMILLLFLLPNNISMDVIRSVFFPLIIIFPFGGLIISMFMLVQRHRFFQNIKTMESEKQYRTLFTKSKSMQFLVDPVDSQIIDVNDSTIEVYQYSYEEMIGMKMSDLSLFGHESVQKNIDIIVSENKSHFFSKHKTKYGEIIDVEIFSGIITINDKKLILSTFIDVTEKLEREKLYLDVDEKLKATLLSVGEGIIVTDEFAKIVLINEKAKSLINYSGNPLKRSIFDIVRIFSSSDSVLFKDIYYNCIDTKEIYRSDASFNLACHNSQESIFVDFTLSPITFTEKTNHGAILVIRDITIEKERQEKIRFISQHDYLTTLYNRFHFDEQIKRLDTNRQLPLSIIIGDVNGLKLLNDTFGHLEGDKLLVEISQILKKATRAEDITSRWGGDEFAILLPQTSNQNCEIVYQRIKDLCEKSMYKTIKPSIAIGFATKTVEDEDINDIIKFAEEKMYAEKLAEGKIMRQQLLKSVEDTIHSKWEFEKSHIQNCIKISNEFATHLS